jgi:hypothetical protein
VPHWGSNQMPAEEKKDFRFKSLCGRRKDLVFYKGVMNSGYQGREGEAYR